MSVVLINDSTLTDIADAIRKQNGSNDTYYPSGMADAIAAIEGGGGGTTIPDITIDLNNKNMPLAGSLIPQIWPLIKNHIIINDHGGTYGWNNFFQNCEINDWSNFQIEFNNKAYDLNVYLDNMFNSFKGSALPTIQWSSDVLNKLNNDSFSRGFVLMSGFLANCSNLVEIPQGFFNFLNDKVWSLIHSTKGQQSSSFNNFLGGCFKLKKFPKNILKKMWDPKSNTPSYDFLNNPGQQMYCLQSLEGIPLPTRQSTQNLMFPESYARYWYSMKDIIFDIDANNQPYTRNYVMQNLVIPAGVGVGWQSTYMDSSKRVTDAASYEALKNQDEWYTSLPEYSRYNHDSAVRTINSLPDTKAFLDTYDSSASNTIKFENATNKGSATDGGAIADLTAAEIAVATAKGWTVTLA